MALPVRYRRAARVYLFDDKLRLLLLRFEMNDPDLPARFWVAPGGGIEPGETPLEAAHRELNEELAFSPSELNGSLEGPVEVIEVQWIEAGMQVFSTDHYFLGRCRADLPVLTGVTDAERRAIKEMRWWTAAEILPTTEILFPRHLAELLPQLLAAARRLS